MNMGAEPMGYTWLGLPYGVDSYFSDPVDVQSHIAAMIAGSAVAVNSLLFDTYLAVGSTDLTGKLYNLKKFGFNQRIKDVPLPGSRKTIKIHQGAEGPGYSFTVQWATDRNAASAFLNALAAIDNDGTKFYPRDSVWYHKIYWADSTPDPLLQTWIFQHETKVYLVDQYLYSEIHQDWDITAGTLPQTSETMENYGHLVDGFESIAITGHYSSPNHVEDLVLSVAGGDSMNLSDHLLSDEKITLGVDGSLTTEWTASIASLAAFQIDATTTNCSYAAGRISVDAAGSAIVALSGPWPTKQAVKMTATIGASGTALIQVSTDSGATWTTGITLADVEQWVSAVYYLSNTAKASDIQIKFSTPSTGGIWIYALKLERVLDCSGADLPSVASGSSAAFTVSCDTGKSAYATISAEYHPRRYAL